MIVLGGHTEQINSIAFSPDGNSVVSGSLDKTVRIWDAHTSSLIGEPLKGHSRGIYSVSYSPLGNLIASGCEDETIRLWDPRTGQQSGEPLKGGESIYSVAFSPGARLIVSGSGGSSSSPTGCAVQLWDVQTRKAVSGPFKGHTDWVWSASFSPNGTQLVSGSFDETICIWDVERTTIVGTLEGHTNSVCSTAFSPDGTQILSCSWDGNIRLWDVRSGESIGEPYEGHTDEIYSATFSPSGAYIASGGDDKTVRLWDVRTGRQLNHPFEGHTGNVHSVAFSPCGQYIASGAGDSKVIIRRFSGGISDPDDAFGPEEVTGQMSTQQMFGCLRQAGCVDLSSQLNTRQESAITPSGGGFGDIWQGKLHDGTKVAIKVWRSNSLEQCDRKTLERAAHELMDLSRMDHLNVHRLQGVVMFRDQYLGMVSEWMENGNLFKYLLRYPDADRYQLCAQVAAGLEYMHGRGKVHGDLKAVHVLVSSDGIAKLSHLDSSVMSKVRSLVFLANSSSWPGTFRWVAPEILFEEVHHKTTQTDVYELGMTMLEIFTGKPPYPDCPSDINVIRKVERATLPERPKNLGNDPKGDKIWRLLVRCWSRNAIERPSSGHVAGALEYM